MSHAIGLCGSAPPTAASTPIAWLTVAQKKQKKTEEKEDKKKQMNKQAGR